MDATSGYTQSVNAWPARDLQSREMTIGSASEGQSRRGFDRAVGCNGRRAKRFHGAGGFLYFQSSLVLSVTMFLVKRGLWWLVLAHSALEVRGGAARTPAMS